MRFSSNIFSQEQYLFWWNTTSRYHLFFKNSKMPTQPQRMFPALETQACSHVLPHGPRPRSRPERALYNVLEGGSAPSPTQRGCSKGLTRLASSTAGLDRGACIILNALANSRAPRERPQAPDDRPLPRVPPQFCGECRRVTRTGPWTRGGSPRD